MDIKPVAIYNTRDVLDNKELGELFNTTLICCKHMYKDIQSDDGFKPKYTFKYIDVCAKMLNHIKEPIDLQFLRSNIHVLLAGVLLDTLIYNDLITNDRIDLFLKTYTHEAIIKPIGSFAHIQALTGPAFSLSRELTTVSNVTNLNVLNIAQLVDQFVYASIQEGVCDFSLFLPILKRINIESRILMARFNKHIGLEMFKFDNLDYKNKWGDSSDIENVNNINKESLQDISNDIVKRYSTLHLTKESSDERYYSLLP